MLLIYTFLGQGWVPCFELPCVDKTGFVGVMSAQNCLGVVRTLDPRSSRTHLDKIALMSYVTCKRSNESRRVELARTGPLSVTERKYAGHEYNFGEKGKILHTSALLL